MRREDTKYWRRNAEGRLVYVPVERERSPQYLKRKMRHEKREQAVEELFDLFDELIERLKTCRCRRNKYDCERCTDLLTKLKASVEAQPWRIKRDSLFTPREAAWTTVYIIND